MITIPLAKTNFGGAAGDSRQRLVLGDRSRLRSLLRVEGVLFIPQEQSPEGVPLLVLTHETSDSLTVFRIDPVPAATC